MIYKLKREYGRKIIVLKPVKNNVDRKTGKVDRYYTQVIIQKAPVLPRKTSSSFIHDVLKKSMLGTVFEIAALTVLIDKADLKIMDKAYKIEINGVKYDIIDFDDVEDAFIILLKEVK